MPFQKSAVVQSMLGSRGRREHNSMASGSDSTRCFGRCGRAAEKWLICPACSRFPFCSDCRNFAQRWPQRCPICSRPSASIPLEIEQDATISKFAIGVRPFKIPIVNELLKACEIPMYMPEPMRVYSLSESYMCHFILYCQLGPSLWLQVERHSDVTRTGGVDLSVVEKEAGNIRLGSSVGDVRICYESPSNFNLRALLNFTQSQSRASFALFRNNCQHFVFTATSQLHRQPTCNFPVWARRLQEAYRNPNLYQNPNLYRNPNLGGAWQGQGLEICGAQDPHDLRNVLPKTSFQLVHPTCSEEIVRATDSIEHVT